jgi:8-oxo-dGTP pyrophosphatase MutT (NUDIX family)
MKITTRVIIVCRRTQQALLWIKTKSKRRTCPGGTKEDSDQSMQHVIARELGEETGLKIAPEQFIPRGWIRLYKKYTGGVTLIKNQTHLFLLEVDSETFAISNNDKEMSDGQWFPLTEIPYRDMAEYYAGWFNDALDRELYRDIILDEDSHLVSCADVSPNSEPWAPARPIEEKVA